MSLLKKLVLLILLSHITLSGAVKLYPYGRVHARVTNQLGPNSSLTVHCQSKDDDLGVHVLRFKEFFQWTFKPQFFILSTLFFCKIQWKDKVLSFDAYKEARDLYDCGTQCLWDVGPQDPCMLKHDGSHDFCYDWPKPRN